MNLRALLPPLLAGLLLGAGSTTAFFKFSLAESEAAPTELHLGQHEFINPLVDCPNRPQGRSSTENHLHERIADAIDKAKTGGDVAEASVYFRDLVGGPTVQINSEIPFIGASLLKVPILIAYLRKSMVEPGVLERTITFDPAKDQRPHRVQNLEHAETLEPGKAYRVKELLRRMIVESDNISASLLVYTQPDIDIVQSLTEMGIPLIVKDNESLVTVRSYASIFRILYQTTYLGPQLSNEALKLLVQTDFKEGLEAGVDPGVPVANKFGEREYEGIQQFHDCGIVYFPNRPYLLCVMTRGHNVRKQIELVAEVSRRVFHEMKSANN